MPTVRVPNARHKTHVCQLSVSAQAFTPRHALLPAAFVSILQSQGSGPHGVGPPPIPVAHATRHYGAFRGPTSANRQYDQAATSSDSKQTKW
jgi:hypothetical protein